MNLDQLNSRNLDVRSSTACFKRAASYLKTVFILMFVCCFGTAMAQHRSHEALTYGGGSGGSNFDSGYGITFGAGIDAPLGNLKSIYKPAVDYSLGVTHFMGNFTVSLNLGYHNYKPKDDVVSQTDIAVDDVPVTIFSNYKVYSGYAGIAYNVDLSENARLYGGANIGGYHTHYAYLLVDPNGDYVSANLRNINFYIAPRLGVMFAATNHVGISLEAKYNFFAPLKESESQSSGTFYTAVAGLAGVTYRF
jgi:hypothetical protein